jgi:predicted RNA-binding protein with TRAM domain
MAWTPYGFVDLPAELEPETGETLAEWSARITAYDAANPGDLVFLDAATLEDALEHAYDKAVADATPSVADGSITAAKISATLKPSGSAATGTEALRAIGSTGSTAAAGNHAHNASAVVVSPAVGGDATVQAVLETHETRLDSAQSGSGPAPSLVVFEQAGTLTTGTGVGRVRFPTAATIISVSASINTAPTGAALIVDVHKNGTTVFTTQADRPEIAISGFASADEVPAVTAIAAGDYLTVDIDQVGSSVAGANLVVEILVLIATVDGDTPTGVAPHTQAMSTITGLDASLAAKLAAASNLSDVASASTARTNLGLGTAATQATAAFEAAGVAIPKSLADAKGDLLVASAADTVARQAVGTDGYSLVADSAQTNGVKWASRTQLVPFTKTGVQAAAAGTVRFRFPVAAVIESVASTVGTAPTGAALLVDVNKNGTTIFTTQGNRPSIATSGFASSDAVPDVTAIAAGDYLTVDVDQVGSSVAGSDLCVIVRYRLAA